MATTLTMLIVTIVDEVHIYQPLPALSFSISASDAFKRHISPIIIDNTNTQAWEMKSYVVMVKPRLAVERMYGTLVFL